MGEGRRSKATVKRSWTALKILCILALAVVFNFYPQLVGHLSLSGETVATKALVTPAFWRLLPWLNAWWGVALVVNCMLFVIGSKLLVVQWAEVVVVLSGAAVLGWLATRASTVLVEAVAAEMRTLLALACGAVLIAAGRRVLELLTPHPVVYHWDAAGPEVP